MSFNRRLLWFLVSLWIVTIAAGSYSFYAQHWLIPRLRAQLPCTPGMTLQPGQSCYMQIILQPRPAKPEEEGI
jgi:hypothetical protein